MKSNCLFLVIAVSFIGLGAGCSRQPAMKNNSPASRATPASKTENRDVPSALPNGAFKAQLTLVEPPAKLRAGQAGSVHIQIRNASDTIWWARGAQVNTRPDNKFYIAAADRWLKADGSLLTNMDGRYGIGKDLKPGEETEVTLQITAPKEPGDYTLEIDLVQEGVAWFSDKGSPTARTKVSVIR